MLNNSLKYVIIPAAGIGSRMNLDMPKQYCKLSNNKTVLDTTISKFIDDQFFDLVIVSLKENDKSWGVSHFYNHPKVKTCIGGDTRFESVFNALRCVESIASNEDWVFVHDAARPAVNLDDIKRLYDCVSTSKEKCGILAVKAFETVKQVSNYSITKTLDRDYIWLAQTPQLSMFKLIMKAFRFCVDEKLISKITDEASALELFGVLPKVVEGSRKNIKITTKEDLEFVNMLLD